MTTRGALSLGLTFSGRSIARWVKRTDAPNTGSRAISTRRSVGKTDYGNWDSKLCDGVGPIFTTEATKRSSGFGKRSPEGGPGPTLMQGFCYFVGLSRIDQGQIAHKLGHNSGQDPASPYEVGAGPQGTD